MEHKRVFSQANSELSLPLAMWLAEDDYDYNDDPNIISTTTLIKPVRQIILGERAAKLAKEKNQGLIEIEDMFHTAFGNSIHSTAEAAWKNYVHNLYKLGYKKRVVENIQVNPKPEEVDPNKVQVYVEQRLQKKVGNFTVTGKFDLVLEGQLHDYKTAGVYSYMKQSNAIKFCKQGSVYRFLDPDIITGNNINIEYIFKDWVAYETYKKGYPKNRMLTQPIPLMSIGETEAFVKQQLRLIEQYRDADETDIPQCTHEELWQEPTKYKYFSKPTNKVATKSSENLAEIQALYNKKGCVGEIRTVPGKVKACNYCPGVKLCTQKDTFIQQGLLTLG